MCSYGPERDLPGPQGRSQATSGATRVDRHAQGKRVDEQAHDVVRAVQGGAPAGASGSEDDVFFSAVPLQQQGPRALQQGVQRHLVGGGERAEGLRTLGGEARLYRGDALRGPRRIAAGSDRSGGAEAREHLPEEGLGGRRLEASQPGDVLAKGARRRIGTPGATAANRLVGPEHLAQDDRERPPVEKSVVEGPDEAATPGCIPDQGEALQGGAREVDAFPAVLREEGHQARFECLCGERPPVVSPARERRLPVDFLAWALGPVPAEGRPEDGVSGDDPLPGFEKRRLLERFGQIRDHLLEVDTRGLALQAVEEHPLLRRGQLVDVLDHASLGGRRGLVADAAVHPGFRHALILPRLPEGAAILITKTAEPSA